MKERFLKDAEDNYDNCYWLKIAADEKIYKGFYDAYVSQGSNINVPVLIENIRRELIDITHQRYDEDVRHLRKSIQMLKAKILRLEGEE
jgi:hypothetical protein